MVVAAVLKCSKTKTAEETVKDIASHAIMRTVVCYLFTRCEIGYGLIYLC